MIIEGYRDAAVSFASELERDLPHASDATTSTSTSTTETGKIDFDSIHERMLIRESIEAGRIDEAVRRVNELDSEVSVVIRAFFPFSFIPSYSLPTPTTTTTIGVSFSSFPMIKDFMHHA